MADNATIARNLYDLWNRREFDELDQAAAPDGEILIVGTGETFRGPEGSHRFNTMWADAFPDGVCTVDRVVASGDTVAVEYTATGTHTAPLVTSMGTVPATGRSLRMQICDVYRFRDAMIASQHMYMDTASMMAQLGVTAEQMAAQQK